MSGRMFNLTMDNGRRVYRVTCKKCGVHSSVAPNNMGGTLPPEAIRKKLIQRGWSIGQSGASDLCPGCLLEKAPPRSLVLKFPASNSSIPIGVVEMPLKAEPPREMAKDDRRIILAKLGEVYLDEKRGYCERWNDEGVAKDLGVPRAWVASLREENFGPEVVAKKSDEVLVKEVNRARGLIDQHLTNVSRDVHRLAEIAKNLEKEAKVISEAMREIQALCFIGDKSAA